MTFAQTKKLHLLRSQVAYRLHATVIASALLLTFVHQARADTNANCVKPPESDIVQLLDDWKTGLDSGNIDQVSAFYADDSTLMGARADARYEGKSAIRSYFAALLTRHPVVSTISRSIVTGCSAARVHGFILYRVTGERKGTRMLLGGPYMAEFKLQGGAWRIVRHTLAVSPRSLGEPIARL